MANWSDLKAAVASIVKTNGNKEITGQLLQNVLNNIITNVGKNATFAGVANPETIPGSPDGSEFYIAGAPGSYPNFNSKIYSGEIAVFVWNGSKWGKTKIARNSSENYIDLTDCTIGYYYSAGGEKTQYTAYCCKEIDLTDKVGSYIKFNLAHNNSPKDIPLGMTQYCYVRKTNGSYIKLKDVPGIEINDTYGVIYVSEDFESLQVSWDTVTNPSAFVAVLDSFIFQKELEEVKAAAKDYSKYQCILDSKISEKFNWNVKHIYLVNEERIGYNTGENDYKEDSNWRTTTINLKSLDIVKFIMKVVPKTVVAIKVFNSDGKEIYRNTFPSLFKGEGYGIDVEFVYLAKEACVVELSYFKDTLQIFGLSETLTKEINFLKDCIEELSIDLSKPDNINKYYQEGGILSEYEGYECKEVELKDNIIGKTIFARVGHLTNFGDYCFVLLGDGTYKPLTNYRIKTYEEYAEFSLPINAVKLQLSWDTNDLKGYFFVRSVFTYNDYNILKGIIDKYEGERKSLIRGAEWESGTYWKAGGEKDSHKNYSSTSINVEEYKGRKIFVSMGYGTVSNPVGYMQYCFVQSENGAYRVLNSYPLELSTYGYIVTLPSDAKILQLSYDKISKYPAQPYVDLIEEGVIPLLSEKVEKLESSIKSPIEGKDIFLFGDSISSNDYTWYRDYLKKYTGAENVYNQGASGRNAAYQASNDYFNRLKTYPSDIVVALIGGNDSGGIGTIGTFSNDSELAKLGESIVVETDITKDYSGSKFIQAISHIIRKWKNEYYDYRLNANLSAKIVSSSDTSTAIYEGTEKECINYASSQGWELGYGKSYYMITTETDESKRNKLIAVKMPKLYFCTTLPQKRYNSSNSFSIEENWERKRLAVIECCNKYGIPCIDLAKEFAIDWSKEPFWPGQGYSATSKTDNQGIYTMDGLHPNEFGYEWISRIVAKYIK